MSATVPVLLVAAGGVGLAHSVLPDHWVPLAVVARSRRDPLRRVARLSFLAGVAHVVVSLVIGGVLVLVGLSFRSVVESRADLIVGLLLIATGVAFIAAHVLGHDHYHGHEEHSTDSARPIPRGLSLLVPFGAAASPDLTILPIFLAAATLGVAPALGALVVFAAATIGTFVGLTTLAVMGGYQVRGEWIDRYANILTGAVLAVIGLLIITHVL